MNPLRDIVERLGRRSAERPSPFRAEAETVLEGFRAERREIEAKVKHGDLTPKVAREQATALASRSARRSRRGPASSRRPPGRSSTGSSRRASAAGSRPSGRASKGSSARRTGSCGRS